MMMVVPVPVIMVMIVTVGMIVRVPVIVMVIVVMPVAVIVVVGLIGVGLWLWMAWANGRGRSWARIVAAILFGLNTVSVLSAVVRPAGIGTKVFDIVIWLAGLGAIFYLFRPDASEYYARSKF